MPFIDIHTHNRTWQNGVTKVINVFPWENLTSDEKSSTFFTAGIHPWYINNVDVKAGLHRIELWLKSGVINGVGEAGLDSLKGPEQTVQKTVFEEHIRLSEKYFCPLTLHCVRKYNDILLIRKKLNAKQPWIMHGFNSSLQMMELMVDAGIHISLGADLLKNNKKIVEVCRNVPSESLFFETDDSGITIEELYRTAANIRGITIEEIEEVVNNNFMKIYK